MPELPEVETVCRGLRGPLLTHRIGQVIVRRRDLRRPVPEDFGQRLTGRTVTSIDRRAKYVLIGLENGSVLIVHLGMSGRMTVMDRTPAEYGKHDHIVLVLETGQAVVFNDPRRFGLMAIAEADSLDQHGLFAHLGPDPLSDAFDAQYLSRALAGRAAPVKQLILDQTVVVGVGNIYASESLYHARISPRRKGESVGPKRAARLVTAIKSVLHAAIDAGGSSLRDYVQATGELGYFQHRFAVYGREGEACPSGREGHVIRRIVQSNRSTFYCPQCQR